MDKRIKQIVENFDYEKVHTVMKALNWTWAYSKSEDGIPTIGELVTKSISLMEEVLKYEGQVYRTGTGGFYASIDEDLLELSFEIESWNCDKDGKCY